MADANSGVAWRLPDFAHWVWSAIKLWPLSWADPSSKANRAAALRSTAAGTPWQRRRSARWRGARGALLAPAARGAHHHRAARDAGRALRRERRHLALRGSRRRPDPPRGAAAERPRLTWKAAMFVIDCVTRPGLPTDFGRQT